MVRLNMSGVKACPPYGVLVLTVVIGGFWGCGSSNQDRIELAYNKQTGRL